MELLTGTGLWPVAIFTVIFILLVDLMHRRQRWNSRYPPGPVPWPVLGNLLQVDLDNMPYSLYKLQNRYGDVFSLQMAWKPVVVINGLKAMQEVLVTCGEDTSDRLALPIFEHLGFKPRSQGVALAPYGPEWREQRRFSVSTLRDFGLGKKSLEEWVTKEAGLLCDTFTAQAGQSINPNTMLNKAVCNVIASLIFARRFEYEDPYLIRMLKVLEESLTEIAGFVPEVGVRRSQKIHFCEFRLPREAVPRLWRGLLGVTCRSIWMLTTVDGKRREVNQDQDFQKGRGHGSSVFMEDKT